RALSAPIIFGAMVRRKVSAAASQPPTRASPQVTNNARISPAISPATMTAAARRMEVACLPSHLWYKVGADPLLIVRVFPIAAAPARGRDGHGRRRRRLRCLAGEVQDGLDVAGLAVVGVGPLTERHPAGDEAGQPVRVGLRQGTGGEFVVAPVGVDGPEQDRVLQ